MRFNALAPAFVAPAAFAAALTAAALPAAAEPYKMDRSHAAVTFTIEHMGYSVIHGRFDDFDAVIDYDPEDIAKSSVEFTIQSGSLDTGWEARDNHVKSGDMLDVEDYPTITFVSKSVKAISDSEAEVTGDVTIKDVTKEETFHVTLNKMAPSPMNPDMMVAGFTIEGEINRSDFGVGYAAPAVAEIMPIRIDLEASPVE